MSLAREPIAHGLEQAVDLHMRREAGRTPGPGAAAQLLALQRSAGNRAAVRAVQRRTAPARSPVTAPATVVPEQGLAVGSASTEQSRSAETTNDQLAGSPQLAPAAAGVPVQRGVWDTITGAVSSVASGVRDRVLGRVAGFARRLPGYELLCTIMGRDVVTGTAVPRTSAALITGFLGLIPGSDRIRGPLQESGAIERAGQWLDAEVPKLGLSWDMISGLFRRAWESLGAGDLLDPMGAWQRIAGIFGPPLARLRDFAIGAGRKMLEFVFEGAMALAGGAGGAVMGIIRRAGTVFDQIVADPIAFGANLIAAIRGGLQAFLSNVGTHLRNGLIGWLTGALGGVIRIPQQFNLAGILGMAMDFLGVTWDRVKDKLARLVGDRVVNALERGAGIVHDIYERGLAAITDRIAQFTEGIVDTVLGGIREWVTNSVVGAAITRLLSMFNPAGAVIQAIIAVYNTIQFFIERAQQLGSLAHAIFDSIAAIASGGVSGAIRSVEQALARGVPVVLGFLSRLIGLGDIAAPVRGIMQRVQGVIDSALDRVVGWIAGLARRVGGALRGGRAAGGVRAVETTGGAGVGRDDLGPAVDASERLLRSPGATPDSVRAGLLHLRRQHGLRVAELESGTTAGTFHIHLQRSQATTTNVPLVVDLATAGVSARASAAAGGHLSLDQVLSRIHAVNSSISWTNVGPPIARGGDESLLRALSVYGLSGYIRYHIRGPGTGREGYPILAAPATANQFANHHIEGPMRRWFAAGAAVRFRATYTSFSPAEMRPFVEGMLTSGRPAILTRLALDRGRIEVFLKSIHYEIEVTRSSQVETHRAGLTLAAPPGGAVGASQAATLTGSRPAP